ncbi:MAG: serine hydrolase domain-containing protein [Brevundimonas sp.]
MRAILICVAALSALLPLNPAHAASTMDPRVADIDAFIRTAMTKAGATPGLALVVVDGDQVVMAEGYGVADMRTGQPVDADTGFYIASATKSFTALAIAAMAARGEVDLTAPVSQWADDSGLAPDLAQSASLADLLSHTSGLDNNPIAFRAAYSGDHNPAVMQGLLSRTVRLSDTPHGVFKYSNAGYNLATTLLEARFGRDWRAMVRDEVLAPTGMSHTTARVSEAKQGVLAVGHLGDGVGAARPSPLQKVDATMQSAGGLISTASDMGRWLELQINDGVIDGQRIFPAGLVASTHTALARQDVRFGSYQRDGYGLGWQTGLYGSNRLIHHFGNFSGSRAHVSFMPERRLGVAVMVNEDLVTGDLADLVANYVYDRFADRPDLEAVYAAELEQLTIRRDSRRQRLAAAKAERAARPWSLPEPLDHYVGVYESPALGRMDVREVEGRMLISIGVLSSIPEAYSEQGSVRVELVPFQGEVVTFEGADRLVFEGEPFLRGPRP